MHFDLSLKIHYLCCGGKEFIDDANWPNKQSFLSLCEQLLSEGAATASFERTFSAFGFVQWKLRNRLGNDKAGKMTFLFRYKNQTEKNKKDDLGKFGYIRIWIFGI